MNFLYRPCPYESRFVYLVPGNVSESARASLNERYGEQGWYSEWEHVCRQRERRLQFGFFVEPSYVFRPADRTGME
jgi:hypothetical protein